MATRDPDTAQPYEYRVHGATAYELCAQFQRQSDDRARADGFWLHAAGRQCFELEPRRVPR